MAFMSPGHPATGEILQQLLPGKKVLDFSIHFCMKKPSYIEAMILLEDADANTVRRVLKKYRLTTETESDEGNEDTNGL